MNKAVAVLLAGVFAVLCAAVSAHAKTAPYSGTGYYCDPKRPGVCYVPNKSYWSSPYIKQGEGNPYYNPKPAFDSKKFLFASAPNVISTFGAVNKGNANVILTHKTGASATTFKISGAPDFNANKVTGLHYQQSLGSLKVNDTFTMYQGKRIGDEESVTAYTFQITNIKSGTGCDREISMNWIGQKDGIKTRVFSAS